MYDPAVAKAWLAERVDVVAPSPKVQVNDVPKSVVPTKLTGTPVPTVMGPEGWVM